MLRGLKEYREGIENMGVRKSCNIHKESKRSKCSPFGKHHFLLKLRYYLSIPGQLSMGKETRLFPRFDTSNSSSSPLFLPLLRLLHRLARRPQQPEVVCQRHELHLQQPVLVGVVPPELVPHPRLGGGLHHDSTAPLPLLLFDQVEEAVRGKVPGK